MLVQHGLDPRKSLGQHFLLDPALLSRIAALAGSLHGRHVLEIGSGPGGLTRALLAAGAAEVCAVEYDTRAVAAAEELRAAYPDRLRVVHADATRLDLAAQLAAPRQVVANLPYNVGTPLLVALLRQAAQWERLTLMFQQEVAERICAPPGTAEYGRLGVLAQWTCEATIVLRVPPGAFHPPPKVWSAVVRLAPRDPQPSPGLFAAMERLTAAAFGQRRKMLRGALRGFLGGLGGGLGSEVLLDRAGIAGDRRAETLEVAEFERLAQFAALDAPEARGPVSPPGTPG